jgi:hypothetical protein
MCMLSGSRAGGGKTAISFEEPGSASSFSPAQAPASARVSASDVLKLYVEPSVVKIIDGA